MVADHGKVGHFEPAADVVEELPLIFGRVLDVVTNELNEIGPDQRVGLVNDPVGGPNVFQARAPSDASLRAR